MSQVTSGGSGTGVPEFDSLLVATPVATPTSEVPAAEASARVDPGTSAADTAESAHSAGTAGEPQLVPAFFDFSDRERPRRPRTSVLGWTSLVFAFLAPPVGLVLSIVARLVAFHRHGWRTWPVTLATGVSIALTVVLLVGGFIAGILGTQTAGVDAIVADSARFCDSLAETPGVLQTAGFGWPVEASSVKASIAAMAEYRDRWSALAEIAPSGIEDDVAAIASVASTIVDNAKASQSIDPQASLDQVSSVVNATGIPAYTTEYCR